MVDLLVVLHFGESLGEDVPIGPPNIPLRKIGIFFYFELEFLADALQYFVLTI